MIRKKTNFFLLFTKGGWTRIVGTFDRLLAQQLRTRKLCKVFDRQHTHSHHAVNESGRFRSVGRRRVLRHSRTVSVETIFKSPRSTHGSPRLRETSVKNHSSSYALNACFFSPHASCQIMDCVGLPTLSRRVSSVHTIRDSFARFHIDLTIWFLENRKNEKRIRAAFHDLGLQSH